MVKLRISTRVRVLQLTMRNIINILIIDILIVNMLQINIFIINILMINILIINILIINTFIIRNSCLLSYWCLLFDLSLQQFEIYILWY